MNQARWCRRQSLATIEKLLGAMPRSVGTDERWRQALWCLGLDPRSRVRELAHSARAALDGGQGPRSAMYRYERVLWSLGYHVAGVDEVGRGSLAGPVMAAAVVLPRFCELGGVADSKTLSAQKRDTLHDFIFDKALAVAVGCAQSQEVDDLNIYQATRKAMVLAVEGLGLGPSHLLVDAINLDEIGIPVWSIVRGDAKSGSIASASIIAKVTRDRLMDELHEQFPHYGFDRNKGYATRRHLEALQEYGPCPHHRWSYRPVRWAQDSG